MHQMIKDFSGLYTYGLKGLYETDISTLPTLQGVWLTSTSFYPHMPIGKAWIYRLLCVCVFVCLFVCTVTDFSAEDKASGVKFCTAVRRRPRQGIFHFGELCSPSSPKYKMMMMKIGRSGQRAGHAHPHVNITVGMR